MDVVLTDGVLTDVVLTDVFLILGFGRDNDGDLAVTLDMCGVFEQALRDHRTEIIKIFEAFPVLTRLAVERTLEATGNA